MNESNKKILGNFLTAFATAYMSAQVLGFGEAFYFALINGVMIGLISAGNEMLKTKDKTKGITKHLSNAVVL